MTDESDTPILEQGLTSAEQASRSAQAQNVEKFDKPYSYLMQALQRQRLVSDELFELLRISGGGETVGEKEKHEAYQDLYKRARELCADLDFQYQAATGHSAAAVDPGGIERAKEHEGISDDAA